MENLQQQLEELFSKPEWTEKDYATFLGLTEKYALPELQSFFVEEYIDRLSKMSPDNSAHANQLLKQIHDRLGLDVQGAPVIMMNGRKKWWRTVAAASVILLLGISGYLLFFNKASNMQHTVPDIATVTHDVASPSSNRATITLANGQKIFLDSAGNGTLAMQNNIQLIKTEDGKIAYSKGSGTSGGNLVEVLNTLTNPRGSKVIDMTLADGSRVWLNAGSSVTYPVAFIGKERKVIITGEAYFEVAHNAAMPFKVSKGNMEVTVLGTHFNVNAYDDENVIRVTLLQGSVRIRQNAESKMLKPGEQVVAINNGKLKIENNVDMDQVMAWKNNLFNFNKTSIGEIMKQMERWYDVRVEYAGGKSPDITLSGIISRNISADKVLEMLRLSGMHFKIEGKKIMVGNGVEK